MKNINVFVLLALLVLGLLIIFFPGLMCMLALALVALLAFWYISTHELFSKGRR